MEQRKEIKINSLPAKTWKWLRLNETAVAVTEQSLPCSLSAEEKQANGSAVLNIQAKKPGEKTAFDQVETGAGREADLFFTEGTGAVSCSGGQKEEQKTVRLAAHGSKDDAQQAGELLVEAKKNTELTVIEQLAGEGEKGTLAFRTRILAEEGSAVKLIQLCHPGCEQVLVNDIGGQLAKDAQLSVVQIFLGEGNTYSGIRSELIGENAHLDAKIGYLLKKKQMLDMNLIANHIGKKTTCDITAEGTMKDAAKKVFRGTIDFKKGASGSKGAETEEVLLLGDNVINQTIPLILCAEEDVEGSHGATIGELDEETLFYLETRGIDREKAENLMARASIEKLCHEIDDEETRGLVLTELAKQLSEEIEED